MGTTQKNFGFRAFITMGMAAVFNGGRLRGKKIKDPSQLDSMFGNRGYSGSARMMLILPPDALPITRSPKVKARKLAMRREKRTRIDARGYC